MAKFLGIDIASVMIGPMIPSIERLAQECGFTATAINRVDGLGRFIVDRIKGSIKTQ
jgi:hypothetical protein